MTVTCGFYNSVNGDRKYNARHFSEIFNGIINDGVFMSIGTNFMVKEVSEMTINVGIGRAWFNGSWTQNDAILPLEVEPADLLLNRIDAVIIEVGVNDNVRDNTIKIITGTPASQPQKPTMVKENNNKFQYPLAYITVNKAVTKITQANIENRVGTSDCPFVTGILETINIDDLIAQWNTQWSEWVQKTQDENAQWTEDQRAQYLEWVRQQEEDFTTWASTFKSENEIDFETWFENIKGQLSTDAAGNLQNQIDILSEREFRHYYGMVNKTTDVNKVEGVTQSIVESGEEGTATTTFETQEGSKVIKTVLVPTNGNYNYTKIVTISDGESGKHIVESFSRELKA